MSGRYDRIHDDVPGESSGDYIARAMAETARRQNLPPVVGNEPDSPGCSCNGRCQHGG